MSDRIVVMKKRILVEEGRRMNCIIIKKYLHKKNDFINAKYLTLNGKKIKFIGMLIL